VFIPDSPELSPLELSPPLLSPPLLSPPDEQPASPAAPIAPDVTRNFRRDTRVPPALPSNIECFYGDSV